MFVAVLPRASAFPESTVLRTLRNDTGITGVYGIRLGDTFKLGADRSVMSVTARQNLSAALQAPGTATDATTQLTTFVDQAVAQARGHAPASWSGGSNDTGSGVTALITVGALAVIGGGAAYTIVRRNRRRKAEEERAALDKLRVVVDEDITAYGETLDRLDFHPAEAGADDAMRADYERALDSYESAKSRMDKAQHPSEVRGVTQALEDGRFSLALLEARRTGSPLPDRRPPCFFDPRHGPSVADVLWTPSGGAPREVPVCGVDEIRLRDGEDPLSRTVDTGDGRRRPYWEAGPAYGPWAGGYFGGGLLPGLLVGTLLGSMLASPAYAADYGGGDFGGGTTRAVTIPAPTSTRPTSGAGATAEDSAAVAISAGAATSVAAASESRGRAPAGSAGMSLGTARGRPHNRFTAGADALLRSQDQRPARTRRRRVRAGASAGEVVVTDPARSASPGPCRHGASSRS